MPETNRDPSGRIPALQHAINAMVAGPTRRPLPADRAHPDRLVLAASASGDRFEMELHFRPGPLPYCCNEPGCHLGAFEASWWIEFRAALAEFEVRTPPPMTMVVTGITEEGALLNALRLIGINPPISKAGRWQATYHERDAK